MKYYEEKDYYRALQLFDQLLPVYRGTDKAEKIAYRYAYCYFNQEQFTLASFEFNTFAQSFPKSDKAEECLYMSAYCKYLDSPVSSLDQTSTMDAIKELQIFINMYPESKRVPECNELLDKLRYKLQTKYFETAKLYYNIEDYNAAITAFKSILKEFPETKYKESILYYIVKANYKYASKSIDAKKYTRYTSTIDAYNAFKNDYPQSAYMKECNNINKVSIKELSKYKNLNPDIL
jgi:outer membrane protein assembly factor BamD